MFWLIPPTEENIRNYEIWILSRKRGGKFFGDQIRQCGSEFLNAGDTLVIPTGWIHAIYVPVDSLAIGGNFLHSFSIKKQLRILEVEETLKVSTT